MCGKIQGAAEVFPNRLLCLVSVNGDALSKMGSNNLVDEDELKKLID